MLFDNKRIVITGGTGSLGTTLLRRLLSGEKGLPQSILVFSRDEAKQSALKSLYDMDKILGPVFNKIVRFRIGDVRDYSSVASALHDAQIVFNAAALKQVPSCEYHPYEAVRTNIGGAENIVRAIDELALKVDIVVGISTDKACKPVNVMGMTKAVQERIFLSADTRCIQTKFICVRYGNVLESRGSVIPLFKEQIKRGGPVTVTTQNMTRFLLSLDKAVDTVFAAVENGASGETYIPRISSANVMDVASALIGCRLTEIKVTGIRPGEKIHEILISEEEAPRTFVRDGYYVISSLFWPPEDKKVLTKEFSSEDVVMDYSDLVEFLWINRILGDD